MTQEELRSYRLTSMEEPTDEMLQAIMEQVAESARRLRSSFSPSSIGGLSGSEHMVNPKRIMMEDLPPQLLYRTTNRKLLRQYSVNIPKLSMAFN